MKLSNKFTLTRILIAPIYLLLYFIPIWLSNFFDAAWVDILAKASVCIAIPLLIYGEFTDFLDGYYARKRNEVSDFGKLFDPFADVFLHLSSFVCYMSSYGKQGGYLIPALFILLMWREFGQNFLRMVAAKQGIAIGARKGGKIKTVVYIATSFYMLFLETLVRFGLVLPGFTYVIGYVLFAICIILSYASFIDYLIHFGKSLKQ